MNPSPPAVPVLFEDNHVLVVIKPAGMPVQADENGQLDLLTVLKEGIKARYAKPGAVFLGLVHRLDQPVSGVMVFGRTSKAAARLSEAVRTRTVEKTYLAVVHGMPPEKGEWTDFLLKNTAKNMVRTVDASAEGALEAKLRYERLAVSTGKTASLVRIKLETGRPHQIRVQWASHGFPLFGDRRYGRPDNTQDIALLSRSLTFPHPVGGAPMTFSAPVPDAFPWTLFPVGAG